MAMSASAAQQQLADIILQGAALIFRGLVTILPGAVFAVCSYTMYSKRDQLTRGSWAKLTLGLLFSVVLWAVSVRFASANGPAPSAAQAMVGPVHSGEAVVTRDGRHIVLPDPTKPEGTPVQEGWQRNFATAMTEAIKGGREQVVLIFSRQGCPWCDRQMPVLHRAIEERASTIASATGGGVAAGAAFVGGGAPGGMLNSPLRVFVIDAGEFPYLAQQFRIEAFPTSMFFGQPGATPLVAQGYLNEEQLDEILHAAAVAQPPAPGQEGGGGAGRGGRRKRRGIFR